MESKKPCPNFDKIKEKISGDIEEKIVQILQKKSENEEESKSGIQLNEETIVELQNSFASINHVHTGIQLNEETIVELQNSFASINHVHTGIQLNEETIVELQNSFAPINHVHTGDATKLSKKIISNTSISVASTTDFTTIISHNDDLKKLKEGDIVEIFFEFSKPNFAAYGITLLKSYGNDIYGNLTLREENHSSGAMSFTIGGSRVNGSLLFQGGNKEWISSGRTVNIAYIAIIKGEYI